MADSIETDVDPLSSLMDLDSSWGEDDLIQELKSIDPKPQRLSTSAVEMDFRRLVARIDNTSTPFVSHSTMCKSSLSSETTVPPCWFSNDSGYSGESSILFSTSSLSLADNNMGTDSVSSWNSLQSQTEEPSQKLCSRRSIDSDVPHDDDVLLESLSETDSAYDETSSVCSQRNDELSDIISTSPSSSCDSQAMDMVFQALDLNSSGYSSIDSSRYCSQHNLTIDADDNAVDMSPDSESSCESQVSVVEMVCIKLEKVLPLFSKAIVDRLIGRKMGLHTVDVVSELQMRNMAAPLGIILSFISGKDLTSVSCVSRAWRESVLDDSPARHRKQLHVKQIKIQRCTQKENRCVKKIRSDRRLVRRRETEPTTAAPLAELIHASAALAPTSAPTPLSAAHTTTKHQQFVAAAGRLTSEESLRKCPHCQHPALVHRVQERAQCANRACAADFCIRCLGAYHGAKDCPGGVALGRKSRNEAKIGGRKSKRNLRRL